MPIAKEKGGADFQPVPAGSHIARCFAVISLGTQPSDNPQFMDSFKCQVNFEIPGETIEINGEKKPMVIQKEYTVSLSQKATLRKELESWRGKPFTAEELKGFDVAKLVGVPCMLSIIHQTNGKGKTYAKIAGISGLPKGVTCPPQYHKSVVYEVEDNRNDVFNALPQWVKSKIEKCREWTGYPDGKMHDDANQATPTADELADAAAKELESKDQSVPF